MVPTPGGDCIARPDVVFPTPSEPRQGRHRKARGVNPGNGVNPKEEVGRVELRACLRIGSSRVRTPGGRALTPALSQRERGRECIPVLPFAERTPNPDSQTRSPRPSPCGRGGESVFPFFPLPSERQILI